MSFAIALANADGPISPHVDKSVVNLYVLSRLLIIISFLVFNYLTVGEPLGFRFISQLDNDKASLGFLGHLKFAKAYLWEDKFMVGLLKYSPFLLLGLIFFIPKIFKLTSKPIWDRL